MNLDAFASVVASVILLGMTGCQHVEPVSTAAKFDAVVAADGSGTHTNVQSAVDAAPAGRSEPFVIRIKPDGYEEHVVIASHQAGIRFVGESSKGKFGLPILGSLVAQRHRPRDRRLPRAGEAPAA